MLTLELSATVGSPASWLTTRTIGATLHFLIEKGHIEPLNIKNVLNLRCGFAQESEDIERLFTNAQIMSIDRAAVKIDFARNNHTQCQRTTYVHADLNEPYTWNTFVPSELVIIQKPRLRKGDENSKPRTPILQWFQKLHELIPSGGIIVVFFVQKDKQAFENNEIGTSMHHRVHGNFEILFEGKNPVKNSSELDNIIVLRKP